MEEEQQPFQSQSWNEGGTPEPVSEPWFPSGRKGGEATEPTDGIRDLSEDDAPDTTSDAENIADETR